MTSGNTVKPGSYQWNLKSPKIMSVRTAFSSLSFRLLRSNNRNKRGDPATLHHAATSTTDTIKRQTSCLFVAELSETTVGACWTIAVLRDLVDCRCNNINAVTSSAIKTLAAAKR